MTETVIILNVFSSIKFLRRNKISTITMTRKNQWLWQRSPCRSLLHCEFANTTFTIAFEYVYLLVDRNDLNPCHKSLSGFIVTIHWSSVRWLHPLQPCFFSLVVVTESVRRCCVMGPPLVSLYFIFKISRLWAPAPKVSSGCGKITK